MKILNLGHFAKARLWNDQCPFPSSDRYQGIVVELSIPRGARVEYGLLGAILLPSPESAIQFQISHEGIVWSDSLVVGVDEVRTGLPHEYRESIASAAGAALKDSNARGTILFNCAAHGAVGSSASVFARLATTLVALNLDRALIDQEDWLIRVLGGKQQ
jgi:hypothetical protein